MSDADRAYRLAEAAIERAKAERATELSFSGEEFRALDRIPPGIEYLTGLQHLSLSSTKITDLAPLSGMTGLRELYLNNTQITGLSALEKLIRLERLRLANTSISDLTAISYLTELWEIWLNGTNISSISQLGNLKNLKMLRLPGERINDYSPLINAPALVFLGIHGSKLIDLSPIASVSQIKGLFLSHSALTDISMIGKLTKLEGLWLDETMVTDLRPLLNLQSLYAKQGALIAGKTTIVNRGITFENTPATKRDARLDEISKINDNQERINQTLAYLRTLPPWPEPYTPAATPDGSPPQPIGEVPPRVQTAKAQIQHLMRNALLTRVSARQFADQIDDALLGVPATNGNQLPEPLQSMAEMADTLRALSEPEAPAFDPLDRAKLELRIAQLEAIVVKLTAQLADEKSAREAAEALAKNNGFFQSYKKGAGLAAGAASISLVTIGVPTAVVYLLGVEHPLVQAFLTVIGRLPKS